MAERTFTRVGAVVILHRDNPSETEARRRVALLLMGRFPKRGIVEVWPGDGPDEVLWRRLG
jgi:hypothetical protein